MGWLKRLMVPVSTPDTAAAYKDIERQAGLATPWWDQRSIPGTLAADPEQPQAAYDPADMRRIDPNWRAM